MQAIEQGNLKKLQESVEQMRKNAPSREGYLDICYFQSVWSRYKHKNTVYCMTLLAHAAVQRNKDMVDVLINHGASKEIITTKLYYHIPQCPICIQRLGWVMV